MVAIFNELPPTAHRYVTEGSDPRSRPRNRKRWPLEYVESCYERLVIYDAAHDDAEHSEFHATYEYRCESIGDLTHVDVGMFDSFPANEKISVQAVTANGQMGALLTPDATRVVLP